MLNNIVHRLAHANSTTPLSLKKGTGKSTLFIYILCTYSCFIYILQNTSHFVLFIISFFCVWYINPQLCLYLLHFKCIYTSFEHYIIIYNLKIIFFAFNKPHKIIVVFACFKHLTQHIRHFIYLPHKLFTNCIVSQVYFLRQKGYTRSKKEWNKWKNGGRWQVGKLVFQWEVWFQIMNLTETFQGLLLSLEQQYNVKNDNVRNISNIHL